MKNTGKGRANGRWLAIGRSIRWLMLLLCTALPMLAWSAESSVLGIGDSSGEASAEVSMPDPFGRDTPRQAVQGFISALSDNDYLLASNYLNLSKADNPATVIRQFKQALDAGGRFQTDLQLSNVPEGNLTDQLPPSQERVGDIRIADKNIPLLLERVVSKTGAQYWQFSSETLKPLAEVVENTEPTLVARYTSEALKDKKLMGYQLVDVVAAVVLTVGSFILTYVLVWLCYHLLKLIYPRVRGHQLPLPNRVILPLAVVIMALMLSEVMVYAGVSVTLREPVNRFTEIASWLAMTWLLLRVIDALFGRAEAMSYKRNHIERVSILGLLRKIVKALLLIFAVIVIFGNLGFDLTTGIAALGVGGLALALGAQKTIENLVGSVVVVADSPVRVGDYCKFGTYEGTVVDIGIRSSRVRTLSRTIVTIPNGDFSSMQIENYAARDMFRFLHNIYLKRNAEIDEIFRLVKDLNTFIEKHELTNQEWNQANINELRQDCYVIQLQAYVNAGSIIEFYDKQNVLFVDILNEIEKYKVEHALPTQQLIVDQDALMQEVNDTPDVSDTPNMPAATEPATPADNAVVLNKDDADAPDETDAETETDETPAAPTDKKSPASNSNLERVAKHHFRGLKRKLGY
ncbi:mechanosensitive ion channel family protein [Psychrobacter aestuarii]|uniref:Mechanosensitive ion channel MscS domain-containing protein n=1 Tax=Psychrobacter aestuarii TaxID=556327 RepID=A0ABN0VNY1_9GAMM|nr:mechanosensitive ion channel family protein [Psychrobacter aestuarii]